jgi:hypothetical protein
MMKSTVILLLSFFFFVCDLIDPEEPGALYTNNSHNFFKKIKQGNKKNNQKEGVHYEKEK